jgi:hypothetical protein
MTIISSMDDIMMNYPLGLGSEGSEGMITTKHENNKQYMTGGYLDVPNGGFVPIVICRKKKGDDEKIVEEEKPKREFKTNKITISIKDIMEKRRTSQI